MRVKDSGYWGNWRDAFIALAECRQVWKDCPSNRSKIGHYIGVSLATVIGFIAIVVLCTVGLRPE